jgi:hypothetical protein
MPERRLFTDLPQFHVGSGLPACRWTSARRRAGERKFFWQHGEPCLDRIPFDVPRDSRGFFVVANEMVVAFVLSEGAFIQAKHTDGFVAPEAFQRAKPFSRRHARRDKKVNVIGHHDERVQFVTVESVYAVIERSDDHFGYFRLAQEHRAGFGVIEQAIHGNERLSCCEVGGPKDAVDWKAAVKAESHEHSLADNVPMREAPVVPAHVDCSGGGE